MTMQWYFMSHYHIFKKAHNFELYFWIIFQNQMECGVPKTAQNTIQKRIIGGRIAPFAAIPWQAHIRIAEYQCGGVLGK